MVYIKRGAEGRIVAVSDEPLPDFETLEEPTEELHHFLANKSGLDALEQTDLGFIRVVEDVIELLISKNIILFTELPPEAQEKMLTRQRLRTNEKSTLSLLPEEEP